MTIGICACGCGEATNVRRDGQPYEWVKGHSSRRTPFGAVCGLPGCDRPHETQGYCHSHYERHRSGRPVGGPFVDLGDEERFLAKVKVLPSGHWMWRGATSGYRQYGAATYEKQVHGAHRVAWMLYRGPIEDGQVIDHLCRVTLCVNPDHLQATTPTINNLRGDSPTAINSAKTHCIRNHEFTDANTYITSTGGRQCLDCVRSDEGRALSRARTRAYRERRATVQA